MREGKSATLVPRKYDLTKRLSYRVEISSVSLVDDGKAESAYALADFTLQISAGRNYTARIQNVRDLMTAEQEIPIDFENRRKIKKDKALMEDLQSETWENMLTYDSARREKDEVTVRYSPRPDLQARLKKILGVSRT